VLTQNVINKKLFSTTFRPSVHYVFLTPVARDCCITTNSGALWRMQSSVDIATAVAIATTTDKRGEEQTD